MGNDALLTVGSVRRAGPYAVTRDEVIGFAAKYDPQPFHLDDAAAAAHPFFDRLCASGWHTCAIVMRLTVDSWLAGDAQPLGGAGIEAIKWAQPVYPGDAISAEFEVLDVTVGKPRPGMTLARIATTATNQDGAVVMTHVSRVIFPS